MCDYFYLNYEEKFKKFSITKKFLFSYIKKYLFFKFTTGTPP